MKLLIILLLVIVKPSYAIDIWSSSINVCKELKTGELSWIDHPFKGMFIPDSHSQVIIYLSNMKDAGCIVLSMPTVGPWLYKKEYKTIHK